MLILRRRLLQIHLPESPPHFTPYVIPEDLQTLLTTQITSIREKWLLVLMAPPKQGMIGREWRKTFNPFVKLDEEYDPQTQQLLTTARSRKRRIMTWIETATPPPTVISFTPRPTFLMPPDNFKAKDQHSEKLSRLRAAVRLFALDKEGKTVMRDYLPDVRKSSSSNPRFIGPGQVHMWPVLDVRDKLQLGPRGLTFMDNPGNYRVLLEDTTIDVLKRFGLTGFRRLNRHGIWVKSYLPRLQERLTQSASGGKDDTPISSEPEMRCIANYDFTYSRDIFRYGLSINVTEPRLEVLQGDSYLNPWARISEETGRTTTSILAEITAFMKSQKWPRKVEGMDTSTIGFNIDQLQSLQIKQGYATKKKKVLQLNTQAIAVAWTHEFARQLGMDVVNHLVSYPEEDTIWEERDVPDDDAPKPLPPKLQQTVDLADLKHGIKDRALMLPKLEPESTRSRTVVNWLTMQRQLQDMLLRSVSGRSGKYDPRVGSIEKQFLEAKAEKLQEAIIQAQHNGTPLAGKLALKKLRKKEKKNEKVRLEEMRQKQREAAEAGISTGLAASRESISDEVVFATYVAFRNRGEKQQWLKAYEERKSRKLWAHEKRVEAQRKAQKEAWANKKEMRDVGAGQSTEQDGASELKDATTEAFRGAIKGEGPKKGPVSF